MGFRPVGVEVVVPATSANLGPGFDSLGLALALHDHLVAMVTDDPGVLVTVEGEGAGSLPTDERHLVAGAMRSAWEAMGLSAPGFVLRCRNGIPQGRGLGSSAAAIVAGILLARGLVEEGEELLPDDEVLGLATRMEGHPDNVAAALLGGFTTAWVDSVDDTHASAVTRATHPSIVPVILIPQQSMATKEARTLLAFGCGVQPGPHGAALPCTRRGSVHALPCDRGPPSPGCASSRVSAVARAHAVAARRRHPRSRVRGRSHHPRFHGR